MAAGTNISAEFSCKRYPVYQWFYSFIIYWII